MTEKYKYSKRVDRDAFFTPRATADKIVQYLLDQYPEWQDREWFEPSAGAGVFLDAARDQGITAHGVDIHPMRPDVEHGDFLKEDIDLTGKIVFGNPPYGHQSVLTVKFINRAFELGAHRVAFLVGGGIVGYQHLRRIPVIERLKAVENRFEVDDSKIIKVVPNVALVVFSGETNNSEWKELSTVPYIEGVYFKDAIDTDYVFSSAFTGTFGELKEVSDSFGRYIRPVRGEEYQLIRFFIGGRKGVGQLYRVKDGFDFGLFKNIYRLSSIVPRLSPITMNYWHLPENRSKLDFEIL